MTLMNGLVAGKTAHLWSDTCFLDPCTAKVVGYGTKAFQALNFPAVVNMTFVGGNPYKIAQSVGFAWPTCLGELLAACENALREYVTEQPEVALARLLVAGWCEETQEARLFAMGSDDNSPLYRPFQAQEVAYFLCNSAHNPEVVAMVERGLAPGDFEAIAEIQRAEPFCPDKGGFAPMYGIGGELMHYVVSREGLAVESLKEWGEPLSAEGVDSRVVRAVERGVA